MEIKSRAGRRTIDLPDELVALLRKHRDEQGAGTQLWTDEGWISATPTGGPTNHRTDYDEWKRLLVLLATTPRRLDQPRLTSPCCRWRAAHHN